jgi:hypothetical protein
MAIGPRAGRHMWHRRLYALRVLAAIGRHNHHLNPPEGVLRTTPQPRPHHRTQGGKNLSGTFPAMFHLVGLRVTFVPQ